ncbi:MAG: septum formation protein Maf [Clostridia bacterium]|nr:septum formation protein Maf [Clostridia bacterium]
MNNTILYLASASPRRREILETAGFSPVIIKAEADESEIKYIPGEPELYVKKLARLKNEAALTSNPALGRGIILTADTVVVGDDQIEPLGKPKTYEEAVNMLRSLSGRSHRVMTGVMLRDIESGHSSLFAETTHVHFRNLSEEEIEKYCSGSEPYDKAGGYGIQGKACVFVSSIDGDYFNVVGLPVSRVYEELLKLQSMKNPSANPI